MAGAAGSGGRRVGAGRPRGAKAISKKLKSASERITKAADDLETVKKAEAKPMVVARAQARFDKAAEYLMAVINDPDEPTSEKIKAAQIVIPYQEEKPADRALGKKEQKEQAAAEAARGRFAPPAPPRLAVNNT